MEPTVFIIAAGIVGFYMAWNIGANDVANSMGTSVGSGVITVNRAVFLAAILGILGAILVGTHVTQTVSKGIVNPDAFSGDPELFMYGMFAAVLAAGIWITVATHLKLPASTTHSIIGAVIGFGFISAGVSVINFSKLAAIVLSWMISPFAGALIAFLLFTIIKRLVLDADNPFKAAKTVFPFIVSFVFIVLTSAVLYKCLHCDLLGLGILAAIALIGISAGILSRFLLRFYHKPEMDHYYPVENLFGYLQILSACCVAFAHGANDVANAVGPVAAIFHIAGELSNGVTSGIFQQTVEVPLWILAFGGIGIACGIATWGYKVMSTIGQRITDITPTRGFAAEFGTAATVLTCSLLGLPISTSHTIVGAVIGVGFARGMTALNFNIIRNIIFCWLLTIPAAALLTMLIYSGLMYVL